MKKLIVLIFLLSNVGFASAAVLTSSTSEIYNIQQLSNGTIANLEFSPKDEEQTLFQSLDTKLKVDVRSICGDTKLTIYDGKVINMKSGLNYSFIMPLMQQSFAIEFAETVTDLSCFYFGVVQADGSSLSNEIIIGYIITRNRKTKIRG